MKTSQYTHQEKKIAAADNSGIRERWLWGLRLLADTEKITDAGNLKHGVIGQLTTAAAKRGLKLSEREIQRRLACARAYPTESQIRHAVTDFETWHDIVQAGFPPVPVPEGEGPADWRSKPERDHDRARALADVVDVQGSLFPLSVFEPFETTLKDLAEYATEQEMLTANFVAHGKRRRDYLDTLIAAAENDMSVTWADAHRAAFGGEPDDADSD